MDTAKTINCIEWFIGYGGNHIGLKRVLPSLRCIAACEIEAYAIANMVSKMEAGQLDPFPIWSDCKTFPCVSFRGLVDLFVASYPCQGFSVAGKQEGESDPRFLWPWVYRAALVIQPRAVFFENVDGHIKIGLRTVIRDLESAGYRTTWGIFSAAEVGAPHQRKRVFIYGELADATRQRKRKQDNEECAEPWKNSRENSGRRSDGVADAQGGDRSIHAGRRGEGKGEINAGGAGAELADANNATPTRFGIDSGSLHAQPESERPSSSCERESDRWPSRPGEPQHAWEPPRTTESRLGRDADGRASRVDRLRLCGNGVVPATAAKAYCVLRDRLKII